MTQSKHCYEYINLQSALNSRSLLLNRPSRYTTHYFRSGQKPFTKSHLQGCASLPTPTIKTVKGSMKDLTVTNHSVV